MTELGTGLPQNKSSKCSVIPKV